MPTRMPSPCSARQPPSALSSRRISSVAVGSTCTRPLRRNGGAACCRRYLIAPCAVLGVLINQDHSSPFEMVWAFSIYLEAVAILPQLFLLQKQGEVENLTSHYVFALGAYRALYLLNWMFRFMTEPDYQQRIVWLSGLVQTALYCDFFYHYYQSKKGGLNKSVKLPV